MGIRVSKTLGWGVEIDTSAYSSVVNKEYEDVEFNGYLDYLTALSDKGGEDQRFHYIEKLAIEEKESSYLDRLFPFDTVHMVEKTNSSKMFLIIIPVSEAKQWHRHGDTIDHYETDDDGISVKYLENGIFPWNYARMDKRTGERIVGEKLRGFMLLRDVASIEKDPSHLNDLAVKYGFESFEEVRENIVPDVPLAVRSVVSYLRLFNDDDMVNTLRPMLATYWE